MAFRDGEFEIVCFGGARVRHAGRRRRRATVALGDEFEIGRSRFRLLRAPEVEAAPGGGPATTR